MSGYKIINGRVVGVPNKEILPEDSSRLGAIFGSYLSKGNIVVCGRDYNPPSRMLKRAFISGLMSTGLDVIDFREAVIGEISYAVKRFGARGGFYISMNPRIRDGVRYRLYVSPGYELLGRNVARLLETSIERVDPTSTGWVYYSEHIHDLYAAALSSFIDSDAVSARGFKVVVDANYGALDRVVPKLFPGLNIEFILLRSGKPGRYHSYIYPLTRSIREVASIVRSLNADLGVIFNSDGSSFMLIDENGVPLLPEEAFTVSVLTLPSGSKVYTRQNVFGFVEKIGEEQGVKVVFVPGFEEDFIDSIVMDRPVTGFNERGNIVYPLFSLGYDALLAFLKILESLARRETKLSDIVGMYRRYVQRIEYTGTSLEEITSTLCNRKGVSCISFIGGFRVYFGETKEAIIPHPLREGVIIYKET